MKVVSEEAKIFDIVAHVHKPFNYHARLWLLLSRIIWSQTFSKPTKL